MSLFLIVPIFPKIAAKNVAIIECHTCWLQSFQLIKKLQHSMSSRGQSFVMWKLQCLQIRFSKKNESKRYFFSGQTFFTRSTPHLIICLTFGRSEAVVWRRSIKKSEVCYFIKKKTLAQVFSCEFCEIFLEHLRWLLLYIE